MNRSNSIFNATVIFILKTKPCLCATLLRRTIATNKHDKFIISFPFKTTCEENVDFVNDLLVKNTAKDGWKVIIRHPGGIRIITSLFANFDNSASDIQYFVQKD